MTRNYEIAEFRETDDLGPTATRKLNSNFRNMLSVMRDMSVGGVDTGAIAAYVLDSVDDSIEDLDRRVDVLEQQGGGGTSGVSPSDADPAMDGTADAGSSTLFSRGDHVHPTDTSRAANTDFVGVSTLDSNGAHGLVPKPPFAKSNGILLSDGNWRGLALSALEANNGTSLSISLSKTASSQISSFGDVLASLSIGAATSSALGLMSATDKTNLDALVAAGPEANVQSDWNQATPTADDYIRNKPSLSTAAAKTVGAASGNLQENGSALTASKAVVTDANKKFVSSSYSLGSACAKTVGAASGNLQENGAALSASKAVVTDANKKFVSSSYTLGPACEKSIGSVADGNTGLVTGDAVYDAIQDALSDVAGALVYKGTAAIASAISGTSYKKGWYWIASATFALTSDINVEPGDMIIAKQDKTSTFASDIDVVQTNIDTLTEAEVTALWNAA